MTFTSRAARAGAGLAGLAVLLGTIQSADVSASPPQPRADISPVDRLLTGTLVEDRRDPRFPDPVDLVIETPEQMEQHEREIAAHPGWFDGLTIGVAFVNDEVIAEGGPAAEQADLAAVGAVPREPAECAHDAGVPAPGRPGSWYLCTGSGDASAYFVPRSSEPTVGPAEQVSADLAVLAGAIPDRLRSQGYYSAASDAVKLRSVAVDAASRTIRLSYGPSLAELVSPEGGPILDYREQVVRTVDQHLPGWRVLFEINGSCGAFEELLRTSESADGPGSCHAYGKRDLQPREPQ